MSDDLVKLLGERVYIGSYGFVAKEFTILDNLTRRAIIYLLAMEGPLTIKELSDQLKLAPSTIYDHIKRLKEAGFIEEASEHPKKFKVEVYYRLTIPFILASEFKELEELLKPKLDFLKGVITETLNNVEKELRNSKLKCIEMMPEHLREKALHNLSLTLIAQALFMIISELVGKPFVSAFINDLEGR